MIQLQCLYCKIKLILALNLNLCEEDFFNMKTNFPLSKLGFNSRRLKVILL